MGTSYMWSLGHSVRGSIKLGSMSFFSGLMEVLNNRQNHRKNILALDVLHIFKSCGFKLKSLNHICGWRSVNMWIRNPVFEWWSCNFCLVVLYENYDNQPKLPLKGKAEVKNPSLMPYVMKTQDMDMDGYVLYVLLLREQENVKLFTVHAVKGGSWHRIVEKR